MLFLGAGAVPVAQLDGGPGGAFAGLRDGKREHLRIFLVIPRRRDDLEQPRIGYELGVPMMQMLGVHRGRDQTMKALAIPEDFQLGIVIVAVRRDAVDLRFGIELVVAEPAFVIARAAARHARDQAPDSLCPQIRFRVHVRLTPFHAAKTNSIQA